MSKKKLIVPDKLSEITLGQYQKFTKVLSKDPDETLLQKKAIEIFCRVDEIMVDQFKYSSILETFEVINEMLMEKPKFIPVFKYQGEKFGFIPKLDDMSFAEFVDLDVLISDWDTMDEAMNVLFRRVTDQKGDRYLIEGYNSEDKTNFKNMSLDVALGAVFFLQSLRTELVKHTLSYLERTTLKISEAQRKAFQSLSVGSALSMPYHRETLQNLKK